MRIILASQSPRRRELLKKVGFSYEIIPSDMDEVVTKNIPSEVVCELSFQKAMDVYGKIKDNEDVLVIGADTVVAFSGEILGKPKSKTDAYEMLKKLQGKSHEVYTGVTFLYKEEDIKSHTFFECTEVTFYPMTDKEIYDYIETGDPMDKAGAYGIQGQCGIYIEKITGDYNNVVGLPIARIYQELKKLDRDGKLFAG
ncbi:MAG: septum formation inhibitor Maf [Lachnospiraceae bacterium]|nr:septum formation inhibitor Maf [Lachnospiraceae bacterium]MBQ9233840.1 septum formation inhibitor Maf [Lachnospiraceae bacterium]